LGSGSIVPLRTENAPLEFVGGKGENLATLSCLDFPVPDGFIVTTKVYRHFVKANNLDSKIKACLDGVNIEDFDSLEKISSEIRSWFTEGTIAVSFVEDLSAQYCKIGSPPVAVRSSATAEDLPDMSFAGQQDTFLNIVGEEALIESVVKCWASLWTARAIGYRARNGILPDRIALAVIVQEMVQSEVSGVLFTSNPMSGLHTEAVIEAAFGLGEALVGGHVEPDRYYIDIVEKIILKKNFGSKAISIQGVPEGGTVIQEERSSSRQALPDPAILKLLELGSQVVDAYDFPQDIEWAYKDGELFLLQSRPITSLYPLPEKVPTDPLHLLFSFGAVQGLLDPMTPLGQDTIKLIFAGAGELFGFQMSHEAQKALHSAGERLWIDLTPILRHPLGGRIIPRIVSVIDPVLVKVFEQLSDDPKLGMRSGKLRLKAIRRLVQFDLRLIRKMPRAVCHPEDEVEQNRLDSFKELKRLQKIADRQSLNPLDLDSLIDLYYEIRKAFIYVLPTMLPRALVGLLPMLLVNHIAREIPDGRNLTLELTRGLPNNVTTEMDLSLWAAVLAIKQDPEAFKVIHHTPAKDLAKSWIEGNLPKAANDAIQDFMKSYGMRGIGEIDIGRPRWREEPAHIMQLLKNYLLIEDPVQAPDVVFKRGEVASKAALDQLVQSLRAKPFGRIKGWVVRVAVRRLRALAGLRESPKFHIIQRMGIIRSELLRSGEALVEIGVIERNDDLFFLNIDELQSLSRGEKRNWSTLISERRRAYHREELRSQVPRVILSDGRTFFKGLSPEEDSSIILGSAVSPGIVEGQVRVILTPQNANLLPGEILVCPGTDPAWTPLFLLASGLVMEVGGMITHGAIVAREYGIPAVVGVDRATIRLKTGQWIRVNGTTGEIVLLSDRT
jgi:pyruvate,water dikinase